MTIPLVRAARFALGASCAAVALAQPAPNPPAAVRASPGEMLATRLFAEGDRNVDQQLTSIELGTAVDAWFALLDSEETGAVRQDDFVAKFQSLLSTPAERASATRAFTMASTALGLFTVVDQNRDASVERDELKQASQQWLHAWDANGDGVLSQTEVARGFDAALPRTNLSGVAGRVSQDALAGLPTPPPSPVLTPAESMASVRLVEGFKLELAASEPMIEDPVALSFDEDGRAYVVEMRGYMLDIDRKGEREPIGRISLLVDSDRDGRFDRSTVFVDGLILPRAVAAIAGGILYVSDYQLYFAKDTDGDGRADGTQLVDAEYGRGNVEHAPNALFRAMDNWIYNGESPYRYRLVGDTLIKQVTEVRGQWGMSQDNFGRLHYNVNNSQLLGDYAPPNYMGRNPHHPSSAGLNLFIATDQRVFPIRMTTAINRGYSPEVLNPEGKAFVFASSCSPVIYRGDNFPADFVGNAFVLDPALNLIKRNLVFEHGLKLSSKFAYENREFLASTDERFRPSNLYNGPDGTLWLIDLYRGIAQYGQFMTEYLRRDTLARGLDQGIHLGRIYRIVSDAKVPVAAPQLSQESSAALVRYLADPNGWIRDTAQRLLVERGDRSAVADLLRMVETGRDPLSRIHALWTLEGLFAAVPAQRADDRLNEMPAMRLLNVDPAFLLDAPALPPEVLSTCLSALRDEHPKVQVAAIRVSERLTTRNADAQRTLLRALEGIEPGASDETLFQIALSAGNLPKPEALALLARIATSKSDQRLIREAVVSGLASWELEFIRLLLTDRAWRENRPGRSALLRSLASAIVSEREPAKVDELLSIATNESEAASWRCRALRDGMAVHVGRHGVQRIEFAQIPKALEGLSNSREVELREWADRIETLFAWPGHASVSTIPTTEVRTLTKIEASFVAQGEHLFQQLCAGCHGFAGQGIAPMAPPLVNSEWVLGSEERLIRIALQGVAGPIKVNGTLYEPPNVLPEMPGLAGIDDAELAAVLSYVRRAWSHGVELITPEAVATVRKETQSQRIPWTEEQLLQIK